MPCMNAGFCANHMLQPPDLEDLESDDEDEDVFNSTRYIYRPHPLGADDSIVHESPVLKSPFFASPTARDSKPQDTRWCNR
jgi:hypothetical protein